MRRFSIAIAVILTALASPLRSVAAPAQGPTPESKLACVRPSLDTFIAKMNELDDLSMASFLDRKSSQTPCYINWGDDGCTGVPDSGATFNFNRSCQRHDFGWRNAKRAESWYGANVWRYHNKAVADTRFRKDMTNHCLTRDESEIGECLDWRSRYYEVVANLTDFPSTSGDFRGTYLR